MRLRRAQGGGPDAAPLEQAALPGARVEVVQPLPLLEAKLDKQQGMAGATTSGAEVRTRGYRGYRASRCKPLHVGAVVRAHLYSCSLRLWALLEVWKLMRGRSKSVP